MLSYAPLSDAYSTCSEACDNMPGGVTPAWQTCIDNCYIASYGQPDPHATTDLPPNVVPTTTNNLPTGLTPPPGTYVPPSGVNWWRVGLVVALGLGAGVVLWNMRGADHAA
jgi:hypothetical protein